MSRYSITLSDGREVEVESDKEPTQDEVLSSLGSFEAQSAPPPDIGDSMMFQPSDGFARNFQSTGGADLPPPAPVIPGADKQAYGRFMQSFYGGLASIPESAAILASKPAAFMESIIPLEGGVVRPPQENLLYQGGQKLREEIAKARPVDPNRPKSFLTDTLPSGAGSMASFLTGGAALKGSRLLTTPGQVAGGVAALGAATGGAEAYREAIEKGADDDTAFKVFAANAALGTTEAVPIAGWLNRLNKASGNKLKQAIIDGSEEAVQEIFQQFGGNLVASKTFDPDRKLLSGTAEGGAAGFTLGSLMSLVVSAIGGRRDRSRGVAEVPAAEVAPLVPPAETPPIAIDEAAINRGLEKTAAEAPLVPAEPVQPTPEQRLAIAAPGGMQAVDYSAEDAKRYAELIAEQEELKKDDANIVNSKTGELTPAWLKNWNEFEALRNRYNGMPPASVVAERLAEAESKVAAVVATPPTTSTVTPMGPAEFGKLVKAKQPIPADRMDASGAPPPPGWVREGDFYVPPKTKQPEGGVSSGQEVQMQGQEEVLSENAVQPEGELVGMGGAVSSEFQPPKPFVTSNKNRVVDGERKKRGLPPMMDLERQSNQDAWDSAMRQIDENPQIQDELVAELTTTPRALTATENAILMHRRIDLRNEYEKALLRWREAFESDDMVRAAEESSRVRDWSSKLSDLEDITKATGRASGQSLQARKMMANEDYSLAAMELRAMEAKGRALTNEEHVQLIKAQERILELENRLTALEEAREGKEVETATTETMQEVSTEAPKESKSKDFDIDREESLVGAIKAKVDKGQLNDITSLVQQLARVFWRQGIRGREPMIDALHGALKTIIPEFTRDDTQRAFSGYGNFKPLSKEEIDVGLRDLRGQTQQVLKMEALEARKPLEKTGQERRVPSDEERRLIKQVNELKRKYGVVVTDTATQLKSALAARKTYYEHRIADLKHEIETRERIVKSKTASPTDAELDAMIAERDRLQREHDTIFPKQEMSPEQQLKQAIAAAQRNLAHWEVRLENADKGIFSKRTPGRKVTSAELELIQAETAAIREHVKELKDLQNPKKSKEEIALQSLKTRMKTREVDFRRRIAAKDFVTKARNPAKLDPEGLRIKSELDLAKEDFETEREKDRWARMSVFGKVKRKTADIYDAARALMTTGEFSFILRQGKLAALSHPIQTAKALTPMFRALLASEQRAREIDAQVHNDPDADAARQAKLHLVDDSTRHLSKMEEILMGRLVGRIPVVRNFNQAAQVFLNKVRLDMFKAMRKSLSKSGTPTPEEDRQIAMFINESTGRGGLGKAEGAGIFLGRVFFAPKYWASRLQLLAGHSMWGGTMRTRRIIATEYARGLIGLGLYYTALSLLFGGDDDDSEKGKVELDPRSTDFGKVKVGNTRLDPLAGLSQHIVLGARSVMGEKKTLSGEVQPIRGKEVPFGGDRWPDIVARHVRGKLHPVPSSVANLFDGTDLGGEEATVLNQAGNMVAPITYIDIWTALKEEGLDDGAALALLALLGEGIQTYKKKER